MAEYNRAVGLERRNLYQRVSINTQLG